MDRNWECRTHKVAEGSRGEDQAASIRTLRKGYGGVQYSQDHEESRGWGVNRW